MNTLCLYTRIEIDVDTTDIDEAVEIFCKKMVKIPEGIRAYINDIEIVDETGDSIG